MVKKEKLPIKKAHRLLAPRLAYMITTVNSKGIVNAAPFSNLTSVSTDPERIVLGVYKKWDTIKNIKKTKQFVVNVPSKDLLDQVWVCGDKYAGHPIPEGINELHIAGLTEIPSSKVKPPRIKECFGHLECRVKWIKDVGDHYLVLGDIVAASFTKGSLDKDYIQIMSKTKPLLEISRGYFTGPGKVVHINRKKIEEYVNDKLEKLGIKVPKKLKVYEKLKFSEE